MVHLSNLIGYISLFEEKRIVLNKPSTTANGNQEGINSQGSEISAGAEESQEHRQDITRTNSKKTDRIKNDPNATNDQIQAATRLGEKNNHTDTARQNLDITNQAFVSQKPNNTGKDVIPGPSEAYPHLKDAHTKLKSKNMDIYGEFEKSLDLPRYLKNKNIVGLAMIKFNYLKNPNDRNRFGEFLDFAKNPAKIEKATGKKPENIKYILEIYKAWEIYIPEQKAPAKPETDNTTNNQEERQATGIETSTDTTIGNTLAATTAGAAATSTAKTTTKQETGSEKTQPKTLKLYTKLQQAISGGKEKDITDAISALRLPARLSGINHELLKANKNSFKTAKDLQSFINYAKIESNAKGKDGKTLTMKIVLANWTKSTESTEIKKQASTGAEKILAAYKKGEKTTNTAIAGLNLPAYLKRTNEAFDYKFIESRTKALGSKEKLNGFLDFAKDQKKIEHLSGQKISEVSLNRIFLYWQGDETAEKTKAGMKTLEDKIKNATGMAKFATTFLGVDAVKGLMKKPGVLGMIFRMLYGVSEDSSLLANLDASSAHGKKVLEDPYYEKKESERQKAINGKLPPANYSDLFKANGPLEGQKGEMLGRFKTLADQNKDMQDFAKDITKFDPYIDKYYTHAEKDKKTGTITIKLTVKDAAYAHIIENHYSPEISGGMFDTISSILGKGKGGEFISRLSGDTVDKDKNEKIAASLEAWKKGGNAGPDLRIVSRIPGTKEIQTIFIGREKIDELISNLRGEKKDKKTKDSDGKTSNTSQAPSKGAEK